MQNVRHTVLPLFFYNRMIFVNLAVVNILLVELKGLDIDTRSPILLVDQTYPPTLL